jgi:chitin disaccharide deacetylase
MTRIWLCADDYGISPAVNAAIRDLVARGRINATSVMTVAPSFSSADARALDALNAGERRVAIGLHVTLTAPFRPQSDAFGTLPDGVFPSLEATLVQACLQRLNTNALAAEVASQVRAFVAHFGRAPDFIDGHQHVQLFPQVRDAVLTVAKRDAPEAWVRQCGRAPPFAYSIGDHKGLLLDVLSRGFRRRATQLGVRTNPAFAGTYAFGSQADFAATFPRFLERMPDDGVVMCHPGFIDDELKKLDPLTTLREQEYAFFADAAFPTLLARHGIALA